MVSIICHLNSYNFHSWKFTCAPNKREVSCAYFIAADTQIRLLFEALYQSMNEVMNGLIRVQSMNATLLRKFTTDSICLSVGLFLFGMSLTLKCSKSKRNLNEGVILTRTIYFVYLHSTHLAKCQQF